MKNNTINKKEIEKFSKIAEEWWNPEGKFKPLHKFNPIRISYIKQNIIETFKLENDKEPLKNIKILDIGCGGGLLSEPMCRLGAKVTGIDASEVKSDLPLPRRNFQAPLEERSGLDEAESSEPSVEAEAREVLAPLRYDLDQAIAKMGLPPRPKRVVAPSTVPPLAPKPIVKQPSRPMQLARQASRGLYRVVSPPQRLPSSEIPARENVRHGADSVKYLFWLCALTYLSVYVALSIPVNVRTVEMARSRYLWPLGTCLRRGVPRVEEHVLCGKCVHSIAWPSRLAVVAEAASQPDRTPALDLVGLVTGRRR